jgi:PleD family two-component response regulator
VRAQVAATQVTHADASFTISISMGVATLADADVLETAIGRADSALYRSKIEGRNRVTVARKRG